MKSLNLSAGQSESSPTTTSAAAAVGEAKRENLLPVDIEEVFERDQKWNKIPNPKNPPSYSNSIGIPADLIRYNLFVATEPSSGKVELTVKTAGGGGGSGVKFYAVCVTQAHPAAAQSSLTVFPSILLV